MRLVCQYVTYVRLCVCLHSAHFLAQIARINIEEEKLVIDLSLQHGGAKTADIKTKGARANMHRIEDLHALTRPIFAKPLGRGWSLSLRKLMQDCTLHELRCRQTNASLSFFPFDLASWQRDGKRRKRKNRREQRKGKKTEEVLGKQALQDSNPPKLF